MRETSFVIIEARNSFLHSPTVTGLRCRFTRAISGAALYWRMGVTASPTPFQARRADPVLVFEARASRLCGIELDVDFV